MLELLMNPELVKYVLTFIFGGGLWAAIKTYFDSREVSERSKVAKIKTPLELESMQLTGLETLAKNLQEDNEVLRKDRDYYKEQYEMVSEKLQKLSDELDRQEEANHKLRMEIDSLRKELKSVHNNSPAVQAGRDDLTTTFPNN